MKKIGKLRTYNSKQIKNSRISIGFECLDRDMFKAEKCYDAMAEAGIKYARVQTGWAKCEKESGVYDFAWLDEIVNNLIERNICPWFNVGFGNPLYMDAPTPAAVGCVPTLFGEEATEAWQKYVCALTEHFKDRISEYEVWNEPDIAHFWHPQQPDPQKYAEFFSLTAKAIRGVYNNAKIALNITGVEKLSYADSVFKSIAPNEANIFTFHFYGRFPELGYFEYMHNFRKILKKYGHTETVIWQGESGMPSWAPENHLLKLDPCAVDERRQAVYLLRRFTLDHASDCERTSFFQMADMMEKPYPMASLVQKSPARHGLLNGLTYTKKKSFEAMQIAVSVFSGNIYLSDKLFWGKIDNDRAEDGLLAACYSFSRNGRDMFVYYKKSDIGLAQRTTWDFTAFLNGLDGELTIQNPVLIDTFTGYVYKISAEQIDYWCGNMLIRGLPFADYPCIICDESDFEIVE